MAIRIGCIVEGHGDGPALHRIIRRIAATLDPTIRVDTPLTIRRSKGRLVNRGDLERDVQLVAQAVAPNGAVFVLIDSDDDCPATLGPTLLDRAQGARADLAISVVIAKREFEAWYLAAAESLRGQQGLSADLVSPPDAEAVQGPKEWLTRHMPRGRPYRETVDQAALAAIFDLQAARRTGSFDKCYREIVRLLSASRATSTASGPDA